VTQVSVVRDSRICCHDRTSSRHTLQRSRSTIIALPTWPNLELLKNELVKHKPEVLIG